MDSRSAVVAWCENPFHAVCLEEPKRPFLFDGIVGRCIESHAYAATPLWAVADPIHCSEAHIPRAKTVTDRTLPKSAVLFPYQKLGKENKCNLGAASGVELEITESCVKTMIVIEWDATT